MIHFLLFFLLLSCNENTETMPNNSLDTPSEKVSASDSAFTYLALGDSYTIGESVAVSERFPVQLVAQLREEKYEVADVQIVARTGWTTDELAAGIKAETFLPTYDLVTLLIGVNNQYRGRDQEEYRQQFAELLQTAIDFANSSARNVIVVSIPDYGVTPFAENRNPDKIARELDEYNAINREETNKANARYVEITSISRMAQNDPKLIAEDGLHPSGKMYELWVNKILPQAKEVLDSQN